MKAIFFDETTLLYQHPAAAARTGSPFYPTAIETLYVLAHWGFKVGVIMDSTMSGSEAEEWMDAQGLQLAFDAFITSTDMGVHLPTAQIYQVAMERAGVTPLESLFVSREDAALAGAQAVQMKTIYVGDDKGSTSDGCINHIFELLILPLLREPPVPANVPALIPAHLRPPIPTDNQALKKALAHVLWIGGAPDAGKTTLTAALTEKYGVQSYHYDPHEIDHILRLMGDRSSPMYRWLTMTTDERWTWRTPEVMLQEMLPGFRRRFQLVLEDLLAMPTSSPIVIEGFGLLPELVQPLLCSPNQAVWLTPTEEFKWASFTARGKAKDRRDSIDPARARHNHFTRDMLLAYHIQEQTRKLALPCHVIDGSHSVEEMLALVKEQFKPFLSNYPA